MIHHCRDDGAVLVHFALNDKYWCPRCKLYRTRVEVAFVKGGKYEPIYSSGDLPVDAERHIANGAIVTPLR